MKDIDVLVEALPYLKKFHDKKILIKYGGHAMVDEEAKSATASDTVLLKYVGLKPFDCTWWWSGNIQING